MEKKKLVTDLGPVRVSRDHNHMRFLIAIVLAFAVILALGWAYYAGYIDVINKLQTWAFTAVFATLLTLGVVLGIKESRRYSRAIDTLKKTELGEEELKGLFGVRDLSERSVDLLQDEIENVAHRRIEKIENLAADSSQVGIFGTVLGIMLAINVIAEKVRSVEDVINSLPDIAYFLAIAFATTLVGIVVSRVIVQFARLARDSAMEFTTRVARTLHDHLAQTNKNGTAE